MLQTDVKGPLFVAGIVVGLSLLLGLGGSYFLATRLSAEAQAVMDARAASARAATLGPRIASLKSQEDTARSYERLIALLLPRQEQLLEIPRTIEGLGRARNVEARFQFLGSPAPGVTEPGSSIPYTLTATGNAQDLADFLQEVEVTNPRYTISFQGIDFGTGADGTRVTVGGNVYYQ